MQYPYPGATTLGIKTKDRVILASEKRLSYGYFVMSKNVKKVFQITPKVGAACAGFVSDMQSLVREAKALVNLYKIEEGREPAVNTVAKVLSNQLFNSRFFPYLTETIVGGIDPSGPHVYVLDPLGSMIEDSFAVVGTGAEVAVGVLETGYNAELDGQQLRDLAVRAIKAAISRDAASGNGIDLLMIGGDEPPREESLSL